MRTLNLRCLTWKFELQLDGITYANTKIRPPARAAFMRILLGKNFAPNDLITLGAVSLQSDRTIRRHTSEIQGFFPTITSGGEASSARSSSVSDLRKLALTLPELSITNNSVELNLNDVDLEIDLIEFSRQLVRAQLADLWSSELNKIIGDLLDIYQFEFMHSEYESDQLSSLGKSWIAQVNDGIKAEVGTVIDKYVVSLIWAGKWMEAISFLDRTFLDNPYRLNLLLAYDRTWMRIRKIQCLAWQGKTERSMNELSKLKYSLQYSKKDLRLIEWLEKNIEGGDYLTTIDTWTDIAISGPQDPEIELAPINRAEYLPKPLPAYPPTFCPLPHRYILGDGVKFVGRETESASLEQWLNSDHPIMVITAIGGTGKSHFVWNWIQKRLLSSNDLQMFKGNLWYSFYHDEGSVEHFIKSALAYFTKQSPASSYLQNMSREEQEDALINILQSSTYFVALDGLERILIAYRRINQDIVNEDEVSDDGNNSRDKYLRACIDERDSMFLQKLSNCSPSKVLITSRLLPIELDAQLPNDENHKVLALSLVSFNTDEARAFMESNGIKIINKHSFERYALEYGGHPLLLRIVTRMILRRRSRSFDDWYAVEGRALNLEDIELKQRHHHIFRHLLDSLGSDSLLVLGRISCWRGTISAAALDHLNPFVKTPPDTIVKPHPLELEPGDFESELYEEHKREYGRQYQHDLLSFYAYEKDLRDFEAYQRSNTYRAGIAHYDQILAELSDLGFINIDKAVDGGSQSVYDMHPLIRATVHNLLSREERAKSYTIIGKYLDRLLHDRETENLTDFEKLDIREKRYWVYVGLGELDKASEYYLSEVDELLDSRFANYGEITKLLLDLFPDKDLTRSKALSISDAHQCHIYAALSNSLGHSGRLEEAFSVGALHIKLHLDQRDVAGMRNSLLNLVLILRDNKEIVAAWHALRLAAELDEVNSPSNTFSSHVYYRLLGFYRFIGRFSDAKLAYEACGPDHANARLLYIESLLQAGMDATEIINEEARHFRSDSRDQHRFQEACGRAALQYGEYSAAINHFLAMQAMERDLRWSTRESRQWLALTFAKQYEQVPALNLRTDALHLVELGIGDLFTAEVQLCLGRLDEAKKSAIAAYTKAWKDGGNFTHFDPLQRAKRVLDVLREPYPNLNLYDPSRVRPIPYEPEVRQYISDIKATRELSDMNESSMRSKLPDLERLSFSGE